MKIAFINHVFILGDGISTVIWNLAKRLAVQHDVTVYTFNSGYTNNGIQIQELTIPLKNNKLINPALVPFFQNKWHQIRKQLKQFDIINTHLYPANVIPFFPSRIKGPAHIYTEWSTAKHTTAYEAIYDYFVNNINKRIAERVDAVLSPSKASEYYVKNMYGVTPHYMYLDGIDFALFDKDSLSKGTSSNPMPSFNGRPNILYVGQVHPHKNIETLIGSLKIVKQTIPNASLTIVGRLDRSRSYYHNLLKQVAGEGLQDSVNFTGVVSWNELPRYYATCDIFATCSLWEGFLRAEAFAMAKPMVAFDISANSETVDHGENGILVKEKTAVAFAQSLSRLLMDSDLRLEMGNKGYKWAKANLDFNNIANNLEAFFKEYTK